MPGACRARPPDIPSTWICLNPISRCRDMTFCIRTPPHFLGTSLVRMGFHNKYIRFYKESLTKRGSQTQNVISLHLEIGLRQIQVLGISGGRALQAPGIYS